MTTVPSSAQVTRLLHSWGAGDEAALEKLTPLIYAELHRLARGYMRREREGHTLQTTALINEAFVKLIDWKSAKWQNRAHFFGISARLMRQILVSYARAHHSSKRGGEAERMELDEELVPAKAGRDVVAVDDALKSLEELDPRKARIVELRFFGGLGTRNRGSHEAFHSYGGTGMESGPGVALAGAEPTSRQGEGKERIAKDRKEGERGKRCGRIRNIGGGLTVSSAWLISITPCHCL